MSFNGIPQTKTNAIPRIPCNSTEFPRAFHAIPRFTLEGGATTVHAGGTGKAEGLGTLVTRVGGGGGVGGMMSPRGSANLLSRLTALTATLFMVMSVILTIFASVGSEKNVLESLPSINSEEEILEKPVIPENNQYYYLDLGLPILYQVYP